jgi:nucleoside 2-deoxyribosyltransferase
VLLPLVEAHAIALDPWSVEVALATAADADGYELRVELGEAHYATIEQRADLVVAVLDQEPPDNGTVAEVAWAAAHRVPVIAYRGDIRASGERGMPYNLMISAAVRLSGGIEVSSLEVLESELRGLVEGLVSAGRLKGR